MTFKPFIPLLAGLALMLSACKESMDDRIERELEQFTQNQCPKPIDKYTVMDSAIYRRPTKTIEYHYTVQGDLDNDTIYSTDLEEVFHDQLYENITKSIQLKPYKDYGCSFHYFYRSKTSGKMRLEFEFGPDDLTKGKD